MFSKFFQSTASKVLAGVAAGYIVSNHCSNVNLTDSDFYNQFINPFSPYKKQCTDLPLCNKCKVERFVYQVPKSSNLSQEWLRFLQSEKFVSDLTKELKRRYDNGEVRGTISLIDDLGVPARFIPESTCYARDLCAMENLIINKTFLPDKGCKIYLNKDYYVNSAAIRFNFDSAEIKSQK